MKKIFQLALLALLFMTCEKQKTRYTEHSPEIDTFIALINDYNTRNYNALVDKYADTAKTMFNKAKMASKDVPSYHKQNDINYSSRGFVEKGQEIEMILDNKGRTWVNYWATWKGTFKNNNKDVFLPVHLTARFIDGKIVEDYGYWDTSEIIQELEAYNSMSLDDKTVIDAVDKVVEGWNAHDITNLKSLSVANLKRTTNGNLELNNIDEYQGFMKTFTTSFPDFIVTAGQVDIKGSKVYINWTITGTHKGDFMGNAPTGKKMKTHGFSVWTMNGNGKFISEDAYFDNMILFDQLGISPPKA